MSQLKDHIRIDLLPYALLYGAEFLQANQMQDNLYLFGDEKDGISLFTRLSTSSQWQDVEPDDFFSLAKNFSATDKKLTFDYLKKFTSDETFTFLYNKISSNTAPTHPHSKDFIALVNQSKDIVKNLAKEREHQKKEKCRAQAAEFLKNPKLVHKVKNSGLKGMQLYLSDKNIALYDFTYDVNYENIEPQDIEHIHRLRSYNSSDIDQRYSEDIAYCLTNTKKILDEIALKAGFLIDSRLQVTSILPINISFSGMSSAMEMYMSFFTVSESLEGNSKIRYFMDNPPQAAKPDGFIEP